MSSKKEIVIAFDLYGTILSTESISKELGHLFGQEKGASIAQEWRKYQLEYTWRLNSMDKYEHFSGLTRKSLKHALTEASVSFDESVLDNLLSQYDRLALFDDVPDLFPHLSRSQSDSSNMTITPVIFSNGTFDMVSSSLANSPGLSPHADLFKKIVVVEPVRRYKPHPEVYRFLCKEVGKGNKGEEGDVWLVSGNPFDIVGAKSQGLKTIWVDRKGAGWTDELVEGHGGMPDVMVRGLNEVVGQVEKYLEAE
ncbi:HAD-like domain-containing protein [Massariosphaeria phaeospora]|uniref:HAD-like domain-containing protein n=1 Tax=Massariosphaeria phaeospora TaxID=100035 RepID=A0A7C8M5D5_9PLEO|nr:HAD-like domain-containing protein [Massariosphaeria phaeospora]